MKTGIFAGKQTQELVSYLEANFSKEIILSVLFSQEDISGSNIELIILEASQTSLIPTLLSLPNPPMVVVMGKGSSRENLCYLTDFFRDFPKFFSEFVPREPTVTIVKNNQKFMYRQADIVAVTNDVPVTIHLRSGNKIVPNIGYRQLYTKLSSRFFFKVSKTAMANITYVAQITPDAVLMENGLRLPLTPEERQAAENAFYKIKFQENISRRKKR
ncbi:MAG: hypothetical protein J6A61_03265 [Clostridia bacterium]|nr:hypothetical protein [Clostridia bacterium]